MIRGQDSATQIPRPERPQRQYLAMLLFALVGGLYLATGFFVGKDLPSWAWALLLALGIAAWATSLRRSSKDAAPSTAATPSQTSPAAVFAVLGHEIYTPISAVKGFAELLRDAERTGLPAAKRREYAELVHASASHLQALVHEMMDAGRLAAGNLALNESDCDLCEIIELALRRHEAEAESRGVTLLASVAEGVAAQADAQRLLRAISGLVANAIRFSPEGSVINVRMLRPDDAGWVLSVTDTGAGLAAEDVQRIFTPYQQLSEEQARSHGSLGLGLYIAREVARLHGGDLELVSQTGVGTEARFSLPPSRVTWPAAQTTGGSANEQPLARVA